MKKVILIAGILLVPSMASAATLSLSPSSQSVNVGDTFTVSINLDTQGASVDGVDIRYLNYNPALLQVQQVTPGTLMPITPANSINASVGRITFSQVVVGGSQYKGSGALATITFKVLASGNASVTFNHTALNTTDSNVASNGSDVLTAVINGSYTVNNPDTSVSPIPTPIPSRSSGGGGGGGGGGSSGVSSTPLLTFSALPTYSTLGTLTGPFGPGVSGAQVTLLQQMLARDGVYLEASVNGFYDTVTEAAVRNFQQKYGIEQTGIAGPQTRLKLNALYEGVVISIPIAEAQKQILIQQIKTMIIDLIKQLIVLLQAQLIQSQTSQ